MPQIFENPFTKPADIPKKRLFGGGEKPKRKLGAEAGKRINKTKESFEKVKYGDHEILANQAQFLFDAEKALIESFKKQGKSLSDEKARKEILFYEIENIEIDRITEDEEGNIVNLDFLDLKLGELPATIKNLKKLESLNCVRNELPQLPKGIGRLKNLKQLNCMDNQLTEISKEIFSLINLIDLDIRGNKLSELPPEIKNLKNLVLLSLSYNDLKKIPPEIGELKELKALSLWDCKLEKLPDEIKQLKKLEHLFIDQNNFSDQEKEKIKKMIPENCDTDIDN